MTKTNASFTFTHANYKTELSDHINGLYGGQLDIRLKQAKELRKAAYKMAQAGSMDPTEEIEEEPTYYDDIIAEIIAEKNAAVERLTEVYFSVSGEMPGWRELDRLSTWVLRYMEHDDEEYDIETEEQAKHRERDKETLVPEVFNDELAMKKDGNRVIQPKPGLRREDEEDETSDREFVRTDYDFTEDKRKYNAPVYKS